MKREWKIVQKGEVLTFHRPRREPPPLPPEKQRIIDLIRRKQVLEAMERERRRKAEDS